MRRHSCIVRAGPLGYIPRTGDGTTLPVVVIGPMRLHHPEPFSARWRAHWIWHEPPAITTETATRAVLRDPQDTVALLRRRVELAELPSEAPCRIWVDGRYVLRWPGRAELIRNFHQTMMDQAVERARIL